MRLTSDQYATFGEKVAQLQRTADALKQKQFASNRSGVAYYETSTLETFDAEVIATVNIITGAAYLDLRAVFASSLQLWPFVDFAPQVWHTAVLPENEITISGVGSFDPDLELLEDPRRLGWVARYEHATLDPTVTFFVKAHFYGTDTGDFTLEAYAGL